MNFCVLGRQPELSLAELEQVFGTERVTPFADEFAFIDHDVNIDALGGTVKTAEHMGNIPTTNPQKVFDFISRKLPEYLKELPEGKVKLGISFYKFDIATGKINASMLSVKKVVRASGRSVRIVPNSESALSSAQTYHNHLTGGLGIEIIAVKNGNETIIGRCTGVQNINALAARDQARPKTDAFVGMLPPKLALTMINLALGTKTQTLHTSFRGSTSEVQPDMLLPEAKSMPERNATEKRMFAKSEADLRILDPFCGTGVVLQEAALLGFNVYGTDLSEKMVDYSTSNLAWAQEKYQLTGNIAIHHGDAIETKWKQPIDAIASEVYLGQPFSAPPSPEKLAQVRGTCNDIIKKFLENLAPQIKKGTPLCLAVPAWRDASGYTTYLPLIPQLEELGYEFVYLKHANNKRLIYARDNQVVTRQILVLRRKG